MLVDAQSCCLCLEISLLAFSVRLSQHNTCLRSSKSCDQGLSLNEEKVDSTVPPTPLGGTLFLDGTAKMQHARLNATTTRFYLYCSHLSSSRLSPPETYSLAFLYHVPLICHQEVQTTATPNLNSRNDTSGHSSTQCSFAQSATKRRISQLCDPAHKFRVEA